MSHSSPTIPTQYFLTTYTPLYEFYVLMVVVDTLDDDFEFPDPLVLTFSPGVMSLNLSLELFDDEVVERDEELSLQLAIPANIPRDFGLGDNPTALITIQDDDCELLSGNFDLAVFSPIKKEKLGTEKFE